MWLRILLAFGNAVILLLILFVLLVGGSSWESLARKNQRQNRDSSIFRVKFRKMSFDFDPNENIDRVEDDNDPQDIESLVGGEGLYGRVPGRPQVGAIDPRDKPMVANLGDQGLPLGRQGQAQAHGGVGQAQGGQAL